MKSLKIKEIRPNPFKKGINNGKLNKEQVSRIKANIKELGLMGSLPVFKKDGEYYLVAGHHRLEALKQVYGDNFEIDVDIKDYSEDQILRGMVIENLTQRSCEYRETSSNVLVVEKYLNENKDILFALRDSRKANSSMSRLASKEFDKAVANDIVKWLDNSGHVISHDEVTQLLNIKHHLAPELEETIVKKHDKTKDEREEDSLNYTQAVILSGIEDHKEQKKLAKVLKNSKEQRVREQGKLIFEYKNSSPEIKKKVVEGEIDLEEIKTENLKDNIKKKIEEQKEKDKGKIIVEHYTKIKTDTENDVGDTNGKILQTCMRLNSLEKSGVLYDLLKSDWDAMLKVIEAGSNQGSNYYKFMERILERVK